jgi:transposase
VARPSMFDAEFRARACELARSSSKPRRQIAADLGVSDTTLSKWMSKSKPPKPGGVDRADSPESLTESERAELKRLRKEQHEWEMEREILKKAMAFWVKENGS